MSDYSVKALVEFLEYAANKGLLNKATANAKRIAVERIFEVAEDSERLDVRAVDFPSLMHRFMNLEGSGFKPDSLSSYQSRVRSGIDEFLSWKSNPMGFRPNKRNGAAKSARSGAKTEASREPPKLQQDQTPRPAVQTNSIPIPIRSDLTVVVHGLPFDLTSAEANKIAKVVMAMTMEVSE
ncbi:hypothetical protein [Devosia riboflavina]